MAVAEEEEREDEQNVVEFESLSCSLVFGRWQVFPRTSEDASKENDGT